jgi:hypothetical protein
MRIVILLVLSLSKGAQSKVQSGKDRHSEPAKAGEDSLFAFLRSDGGSIA